MTSKDLKNVLEKHKKWLRNENGGEKADLRGADLREANLREADLRGADLSGANLREANLRGAYLDEANLDETNLRGAYLRGAYLRGADLRRADLRGTYLRGVDLSGAYLSGADLRGADLRGAYLRGANLSGANLRGAYLSEAKLDEAKLDEAENIPYIPMICPEEGSLIGYKKVKYVYIIKLFIPAEAKRSSSTSRKCRCEFADVLEIVNFKTGETIDKIVNDNYKETIYETGKRVYPDSFDNNRWNECSNGIHFFINRKEAEMY